MAPASSNFNPPRTRKRVEVETGSLKRAKDGSAFTRCEACTKDVPVVLIDMHSCSLDSKIRMNLEAQVVETVTDLKKVPKERRKKESAPAGEKATKEKKEKKAKDLNKPKRPQTAFFLFMDDFRKVYKKAHPDSKNVAEVAKEGGAKWKSLTEEERKPYVDKAAELKAEYERTKENCNTVVECEEELAVEDDVEEASEKDE